MIAFLPLYWFPAPRRQSPPPVASALGNACRLARAAAQIIELRPAHHAAPHYIDRRDPRRVEGEDALHAFSVRHFAQCEVRIDAGVSAADAHALEDLDALALAFDDPHTHPHRVPRLKFGHGTLGGELFYLLLLELLQEVH
jgi:hypothetical protein